tara:strand:+ start:1886 stop:2143 length:258 start_codon:yes stop_codon:yes gene_type:complete
MNIIVNESPVIWIYEGYDDGELFEKDTIWRNLSSINSAACEYAYQTKLDRISTNNGEYIFDIKNSLMYLNSRAYISPYLRIKRTL